MEFGIKPWEMGRLTPTELDAMLTYLYRAQATRRKNDRKRR